MRELGPIELDSEHKRRFWVVLTFGDTRQYGGNRGYRDLPSEYYLYDSFVSNHKRIRNGDCLIVCDRDVVLRVGLIADIESSIGTKDHSRCPTCQSSKFEKREYLTPRYRCRKGHTFESPSVVQALSTNFKAVFGQFRVCDEPVSRSLLKKGIRLDVPQAAMQPFDLNFVDADLRLNAPEFPSVLKAMVVPPAPLSENTSGERRPPTWSRDELILVLDVYFRVDPRKARQGDPEVIELSSLLRQMHGVEDGADGRFRSVDSIHLKLQNFMRFDPRLNGSAMSAGNKLEKEIWDEFQQDRSRLAEAAQAIRAGLGGGTSDGRAETRCRAGMTTPPATGPISRRGVMAVSYDPVHAKMQSELFTKLQQQYGPGFGGAGAR